MKCMGHIPRPPAFKPLVSESISFTSFLSERPNLGTLLREEIHSVGQYFGLGYSKTIQNSSETSPAIPPVILEEPLDRLTREDLNNEIIGSLEHIREMPDNGNSPSIRLSSLDSFLDFSNEASGVPGSPPSDDRVARWIYSDASEILYSQFRLTPMPLFSPRSLRYHRRQFRLEQTRRQNDDEIHIQDIHPGYQTFNGFDALLSESDSSPTLVSGGSGNIVQPSLVREFELRKFRNKPPKRLKLRLRTTRYRRQRG